MTGERAGWPDNHPNGVEIPQSAEIFEGVDAEDFVENATANLRFIDADTQQPIGGADPVGIVEEEQ